ncbi:WD repeat-containing protein l(2)05287 [Choristoneura fumiferana]|uniref:WD repeat-containing protein l(2)05287 n=1 Tax=Choristoneura fumiferana TaxID=7141 RepID=UPI003D1574DD
MVVKIQKSNEETTYNFTRKAGRSIIEHRPVFSPDGESLVVIVEKIARVYNVQTGDCVRVLETETNIDELIGICFDKEGFNVYGCSRDGLLITWTWEKGAVLREFKLPNLRKRQVCTFDLIDSERCLITSVNVYGGPTQIFLGSFSLKTNLQSPMEFTSQQIPFFGIVRVSLGWCNGEHYAAIINGSKFVYIQHMAKPHIHAFHSNYNEFRVLDVSCHQHQSAVAIVDTLGRATIVRGDLFNYKAVAREVLHWHHLPAFAVKFSTQGSYLITGGMEKVLVKWTIGNLADKANQKEFIPRLPGLIKFVAVSNSHIAVTLSNNSIVIANAQMRVHCTILECGGLSAAARAGAALLYHRRTACLLMGGRPGHLQLYSTASDKVLCNLDITDTNSIPTESKHDLIPLETEVTCAATSGDGNWLVTSEYRNDGVTYPEEKLKFWVSQLSKGAVPFTLVTCVNLSHGGCNVVAISLNTLGTFCVTAGTDQKFRIWKQDKATRQKREWSCLTACYYSSGVAQFQSNSIFNDIKKFNISSFTSGPEVLPYMKEVGRRGDLILRLMNIHKEAAVGRPIVSANADPENEMGGVAISQDGSLIAAWFGCKLTLWDTHLCNLRTTLSHPALRPKGVHVQFGIADAAHYLVCTTENCLAVFSLLSLTVKWLVNIKPTCLVSDPFSNKMAVVTTQNDVFVFTPHSSTPILRQNGLVDPRSGVINICTFAKAVKKNDVLLYFMRNNSEIYCLEPERTTDDRLEVISSKNVPTSNFSALLAEQQLSEVRPLQAAELHELNNVALGNNAIKQFLSAAPHMVPPVNLISTAFLEHISGQETTEEPEETEAAMEVDPQSSDDEEEVVSNGADETKTQLWTANYDEVNEKKLRRILKLPVLHKDAAASIFGVKSN